MSWLCSNGTLMGRPAQESSTAGNCRKSPSSRNFTSAFSPTDLRTQWSAVCAPSPRFCAEQCVLDTRCTASPCSHSLATMVRARCVFPVPGRPVSSRELPGVMFGFKLGAVQHALTCQALPQQCVFCLCLCMLRKCTMQTVHGRPSTMTWCPGLEHLRNARTLQTAENAQGFFGVFGFMSSFILRSLCFAAVFCLFTRT